MSERTLEARALWGTNEDRPDPAESMRRAVRWAEVTGATNIRHNLYALGALLEHAVRELENGETADALQTVLEMCDLVARLKRELGVEP